METSVATITGIAQVISEYEREVMFVKLEERGNNRYVPARGYTDVGNSWMPFCSSAADFLRHAIIIMDVEKALVLGCLWEDQGHLYLSKSGWKAPHPGYLLPGVAGSGFTIDLIVTASGTIEGRKVTKNRSDAG